MTQTRSPHPGVSIPSPGLDQLADECLEHLAREESLLMETRDVLIQIRRALIEHDVRQLEMASQQRGQTAVRASQLADARQVLRSRIALALNSSVQQATIRALARHAPPILAGDLLESRQRLDQLTGEIESLNENNAALIRHSMDLWDQVLWRLTGGSAESTCYARSGQLQRGDPPPVFEASY